MEEQEIKCKCGSYTNYGIVYLEDNTFQIKSCCGGGCYAAINIKHCPYCGKKLQLRGNK